MSSPAILSSSSSQDSSYHSPNPHSAPSNSPTPTPTLQTAPAPAPLSLSTSSIQETPNPPPRASTPSTPPYSPLTPTLSTTALPKAPPSTTSGTQPRRTSRHSDLTTPQQQHHQQQTRPRPPVNSIPAPPPPVPISEDTNPDVIAVRAALDVLQIQRQRALRDIRVLRDQKVAALGDPQGFAERIARGPTGERDRVAGELRDDGEERMDVDDDGGNGEGAEGRFGELPGPQDVVRCPPVNWTKYHVAEGALDVLHEEQRRRPGGGAGPDHAVVAPYRPFVDGINRENNSTIAKMGMQKRRGT